MKRRSHCMLKRSQTNEPPHPTPGSLASGTITPDAPPLRALRDHPVRPYRPHDAFPPRDIGKVDRQKGIMKLLLAFPQTWRPLDIACALTNAGVFDWDIAGPHAVETKDTSAARALRERLAQIVPQEEADPFSKPATVAETPIPSVQSDSQAGNSSALNATKCQEVTK